MSAGELAIEDRHVAAPLVANDDLIAATPGEDRPSSSKQGPLVASRRWSRNTITWHTDRNLDRTAGARMADVQHHRDKFRAAARPGRIAIADPGGTARKRAAAAMTAGYLAPELSLGIRGSGIQRGKCRHDDENRCQNSDSLHGFSLNKPGYRGSETGVSIPNRTTLARSCGANRQQFLQGLQEHLLPRSKALPGGLDL